MNRDRITVLFLAILAFNITSCNINVVEQETKSGYFILTPLSKEHPGNPLAKNGLKAGEVDFFLGHLKASREFYFLLLNGGDSPIFDIQLQAGNEAFIVAPDIIDMLPGSTTINNETSPSFIPLITLGILHGTQIYGIGYTDLLEMGNHSSIITVSGKTLSGNDTVTVSDDFVVEIVAHIMDISIKDGDRELDLTKRDFAVSSNLGGLGFMRGYDIYTDDIELKNIGNVQIQVFYGDEDDLTSNSLILQSDETNSITIENKRTYLKLDSDGTVTHESRIQLGNDGNGYIYLHRKNFPDTSNHQPDSLQLSW